MSEPNYRYGAGPQSEPTPQQLQEAAYIQALQHQHAKMLDGLVARYMLWVPELLYPAINAAGVIHTIIQLRDGRECSVVTASTTGETIATDWEVPA